MALLMPYHGCHQILTDRIWNKWNSPTFSLLPTLALHIQMEMVAYIYICCRFNSYILLSQAEDEKTEAQAIFLNPFTVCSLCNQKFAACPFVNKETNGSYLVASRQNRLAHFC
jgi:hypothetical protein